MNPQPDAQDRELRKYRAYLYVLARAQVDRRLQGKIDLSGIVQQTLLEAHQAAEQLKGFSPAEKAAWLRRALAHNLTDEVRRLTRGRRDIRRERSLQDALEQSSACLEAWLAAELSSPDEQAERQDQAFQLAEALARLPDGQRRAVELRHLKGLSIAAVAAELGCRRPAVVGLLNRGVKKLRELLRQQERDA